MRNIRILRLQSRDFGSLHPARQLAIDSLSANVYVAHDFGFSGHGLDTEISAEPTVCVNLQAEGFMTDPEDVIVAFTFLPDQQLLCIATHSGNLISFDPSSEQVSGVGTVVTGIRTMAWSPDFEIAVVVTGNATLLLMNRDFDPVLEVEVNPSGFGQDEFITAGWGKKETQFHGSEGKSAAVTKVSDPVHLSPSDDLLPRVSWRGDGQYFAVSCLNAFADQRVVRVWTREGIHSTTMEQTLGLEHCLAWKPSGSLVAATRVLADKAEVIFFERNGLRHGEFVLPVDAKMVRIREVSWNTDSTLIAVWLSSESAEIATSSNHDCIQLWAVANYKWYLKQELSVADSQNPSACFQWDVESAYRLHVLCTSGHYRQFDFGWIVNASGHADADVAVIDGNKLLLTSFRLGVVPPPMCMFELSFESAINQVSWLEIDAGAKSSTSQGKQILAHLSNGDVVLQRWLPSMNVNGKLTAWLPTVLTLPTVPNTPACCLYQFTVVASDRFMAIGEFCGSQWILCYEMPTPNDVVDGSTVNQRACQKWPEHRSPIYLLQAFSTTIEKNGGTALLELENGEILCVSERNGELEIAVFASSGPVIEPLKLPSVCQHLECVDAIGRRILVALNDRFQIFIDKEMVATSVTSIALHDECLLFTTLEQQLYCVPFCDLVKALSDSNAKPLDMWAHASRAVERGSVLITCVRDETKVILQLPRGNLETIHPRPLMLSMLKRLLNERQFKQAVLMMKRHRIDMNLLYDHDPKLFLANVSELISQVNDAALLNLFLSDLRNDDVTKTMYAFAYGGADREVIAQEGKLPAAPDNSCIASPMRSGKTNVICDALIHAIESSGTEVSQKFLTTLMHALAKCEPTRLDVALDKLKLLREQKNYQLVDLGLRHLLYLVDVNHLFDTALGTYDFELVLMVAEKSQKDPKEYLSFLNELNKLESNYRKFKINVHLRRYEKALACIALCGNDVACDGDHFDECVQLIKDHALYKQALRLFATNSSKWIAICKLYADFLNSKMILDEAASLYKASGHLPQALACYAKSLNWRLALAVAFQLHYNVEQTKSLANEIASRLQQKRQFHDAALVYELYAKDALSAVNSCVEGGLWQHAYQLLLVTADDNNSIEAILKPAAIDRCRTLLDYCAKCALEFQQHCERLAIVRAGKRTKWEKLLEKGESEDLENAEAYSEASSAVSSSAKGSITSQRSRYFMLVVQPSMLLTLPVDRPEETTGRRCIFLPTPTLRSKQSRKAEKKKQSMKLGSAYEDAGLLKALADIVSGTDSLKEELKALIWLLCEVEQVESARKLQMQFTLLFDQIELWSPKVWPDAVEPYLLPGPPEDFFDSMPQVSSLSANAIIANMKSPVSAASWRIPIDPLLTVPSLRNKALRWKLEQFC